MRHGGSEVRAPVAKIYGEDYEYLFSKSAPMAIAGSASMASPEISGTKSTKTSPKAARHYANRDNNIAAATPNTKTTMNRERSPLGPRVGFHV